MEPLILKALHGKPVERPPVWLMRQAGRYLAEYQEIKSRHSFLEMCTTPELALEVSLQPVRIFDVDAAIVFADILLPLQAMGMKIDFQPGPKVHNPIQIPSDIEALAEHDPASKLDYVMRTIGLLRAELDETKAVIGFAGAPWTMACYMIDQGPWKHFAGTQIFAYEHREAMHHLLEKVARLTTAYLTAQIESGADTVQLFDSWAGVLNLDDYRELALPYVQKIFDGLKKTGKPLIYYVNGSAHLFPAMLESGATVLSIDWRTSLPEAQSRFPIIQGNLDPSHLFGGEDAVRERTTAMLRSLVPGKSYIANLGHGVLQKTPRENVRAFVDTVRAWKGR